MVLMQKLPCFPLKLDQSKHKFNGCLVFNFLAAERLPALGQSQGTLKQVTIYTERCQFWAFLEVFSLQLELFVDEPLLDNFEAIIDRGYDLHCLLFNVVVKRGVLDYVISIFEIIVVVAPVAGKFWLVII